MAIMHKIWRQIVINFVLLTVLRIKNCYITIKKIIMQIKATNNLRKLPVTKADKDDKLKR